MVPAHPFHKHFMATAMNRPCRQPVLSSELIGQLGSQQIWEFKTPASEESGDARQQAFNALQSPEDFPPIESVVVPGDRITLAVDPNVPEVAEVVGGVIEALSRTGAGKVDVVLWDEASDETLASVIAVAGESIGVTRHDPTARDLLRYIAADQAADPIYLNRRLVDADFVLPIVAVRPLDALPGYDLSGVYPALADSATRQRDCEARIAEAELGAELEQDDQRPSADEQPDITWLLGVQLVVCVSAGPSGNIGRVVAGTVDASRKWITASCRAADEIPPSAPLVIASLEGDSQQQSWANAARAITSASRHVTPGGTIVLWSQIDSAPTNKLASLADDEAVEEAPFVPTQDAEFPPWDESVGLASSFARVAGEHRVLIHSRLDNDMIESMGIGVIGSADELCRLSRSFDACCVLRAAQFSGVSTVARGGC